MDFLAAGIVTVAVLFMLGVFLRHSRYGVKPRSVERRRSF